MAIEIRTLSRPKITLVGNIRGSEFFDSNISRNIDHYKRIDGTSVISTTHLEKNNVLIFDEQVRVIITGQVSPKPTYRRQSGILDSLSFEGKKTHDSGVWAETYYTLNNKSPVRTANYLYKYTDLDDLEVNFNENNPNPSDPSDVGIKIGSEESPDNLNNLGFILKCSPTGHNNYVLKVKTFYQGRISQTAIAYFKIYRSPSNSTRVNNFQSNI